MAALVVIALVVVIAAVASQDGTHRSTPPTSTTEAAPAGPLPIQTTSVFHLERDADNSVGVSKAHDGDLTTGWSTDAYFTPNFGNLRHGLGLAIQLNGSHKLRQLKVYSPSQGWSAEVYVANAIPDPPALAPWGPVLDNKGNIAPGWTTFNLGGTQGSAVLIWISYLGSAGQVKINEVQVS